MKKLFIIVEGQTELEFVKQVLIPYFQTFVMYEVIPYCVRTSKTGKGGIINYIHIKNDIQKVLNDKSKNVILSTFIDFFESYNMHALTSTAHVNTIAWNGSGQIVDGSSTAKDLYMNFAGTNTASENATISAVLEFEYSIV